MTANEKKDLSIIVQLRRTSNFQAEVIRRYAKFMTDLDKLIAYAGSDECLDKTEIDRLAWNVRLDITKLIDKTY